MGTSAPPLPEYLYEPVEQEDRFEALIKEARRRARRRRLFYGVMIAVIAAGLVAYVAPSDAPPAEDAAPKPQSEPPEHVVTFDGNATSLVGQWAELHVGYVLAYGDGRVIWMPDAEATLAAYATDEPSGGTYGFWPIERRLSAFGRDLVASGTVQLEELLHGDGAVHRRDALWTDSTAHPYNAEKFAACYWLGAPPNLYTESVSSATLGLPRLPPPAQALLTGREHAYPGTPISDNDFGLLNIECSELAADETLYAARVLAFSGAVVLAGMTPEVIFATPTIDGLRNLPQLVYAPNTDGEVSVGFSPIMPHGDFVLWGG
jgi:hypothetical protein